MSKERGVMITIASIFMLDVDDYTTASSRYHDWLKPRKQRPDHMDFYTT